MRPPSFETKMTGAVSLRPLVADGVAPFAELFPGRETDAAELLVELIVGLSNYSEEGFQYAPVVFLTAALESTLSIVRGSNPIVIGNDRRGAVAARTALRNCAPLGEGRRWAVFVRLAAEGCDYGLFCSESSPLRPTSFDLLRRVHHAEAPFVGLTQLRAGVVEIRSSTGRERFFDFSGSREEATSAGRVVRQFVSAVTAAAPPQVAPQLRAFYYRMTVDILTGNHGALAAVLPTSSEVPDFLRDGIWLQAPVDLVPWIARDNEASTSEATRVLFAYAGLIRRMTMMDGVTVFGSDGTVRAYGCFLQEPGSASRPAQVVGGARQRAYGVLRDHVGTRLVAALYRSQDGAADCSTAAHGEEA